MELGPICCSPHTARTHVLTLESHSQSPSVLRGHSADDLRVHRTGKKPGRRQGENLAAHPLIRVESVGYLVLEISAQEEGRCALQRGSMERFAGRRLAAQGSGDKGTLQAQVPLSQEEDVFVWLPDSFDKSLHHCDFESSRSREIHQRKDEGPTRPAQR